MILFIQSKNLLSNYYVLGYIVGNGEGSMLVRKIKIPALIEFIIGEKERKLFNIISRGETFCKAEQSVSGDGIKGWLLSRNLNEWGEERSTVQGRSIPGTENNQCRGSDESGAPPVFQQQ